MDRIGDLLKGVEVEWKLLGDIAEIMKGKQFNKRDMIEGAKYPVINGGITPSGYVEVYNADENTITISQGGASAGYVNFIKTKFWLGAHAFAVLPKEKILKRYIYHFLKMNQEKLQKTQVGAGIPSVSKSTLIRMEIPIPSLEIQEKIAKTLDQLTDYVTELTLELTSELTARKNQYSYYRDLLLSEEYLNRLLAYEVKFVSFGDIVDINLGGGTPSKSKSDYWNGGIPWASVKDIVRAGMYLDKTIDNISQIGLENSSSNIIPKDWLIICTRINPGLCAISKKDIAINQDLRAIRFCKGVDVKYIYYYFQQINIEGKGSTVKGISIEELNRIMISLPPIHIQRKVVEILDKFQEYINDIIGVLPGEIEQRKKQYEYYREKLLTFK